MKRLIGGLTLAVAGVLMLGAAPASAQYYGPGYRPPPRIERLRYECDRGDRRACHRLHEIFEQERDRRGERYPRW